MSTLTPFKSAYNYLLFIAVVLIAVTFFTHGKTDFHWHDTYIVISDKIIIWLCAAVLFFVWGIYYLLRNVLLAKWLTRLHVISIFVLILFACTANIWHETVIPKRSIYYYKDFDEDNKRLALTFLPIAILFIAGQLAFFVNTIGGSIKYLKNKNR